MKELGITHVVTVIIGVAPIFPQHFAYHLVPVRDIPEDGPSLYRHLGQSVHFIEDALSGSPDAKVYVHCMAGRSRSATVVAAWLIATKRYRLHRDAIAFLQGRRSVVQPNAGFVEQLARLEQELL